MIARILNGQRSLSNFVTVGVVLEERFQRTPDGRIYSPSGFGNEFWARYLRSFDYVSILARCEWIAKPAQSAVLLDRPQVVLRELPNFVGFGQFSVRFPSVIRSMKTELERVDGVILRLPGTLGLVAGRLLRTRCRAYAVELVGDPQDVFSAGVGGVVSPLLRKIFHSETVRLCGQADAVSYVTWRTLQKKYPPGDGAVESSYSSVQLPDHLIREFPRQPSEFRERPFRIFSAASLEVPYKGIDVLIEAMAILRGQGEQIELRIAGAGRCLADLQALAMSRGLSDCIDFLGRIPREEVLKEMDNSHLYVQPSRTEGLPRSIIESFARASPVVATSVGGVPELVDGRWLAEPGNAVQLASIMSIALNNPIDLADMSKTNLGVASRYRQDILERRRTDFYGAVRKLVSTRR